MKIRKDYKYILFDLDRTLWDFDANARNNIYQLLDKYNVPVGDKSEFFEQYEQINHILYAGYEK